MSTDKDSRPPNRRTIAQLIDDQQSNNDIMPLVGGHHVTRRVQSTQDKLLADSFTPLKLIDSKYKTKPKEGDQLVAPETCLYWLSLNISNRAVADARVYDLGEDMIADEWHNTFTPVMFYTGDGSKSFILANGQTRMWAGWLTGCTVEHTVRITDDPKVLIHIDDHKARSVADLLSTHKYANNNMLASATGIVRAYQEYDPPFAGAFNMHSAPKYNRDQILEYCQEHPEFVNTVNDGHRALPWTKRMFRSPSLACSLYYLTWVAGSGWKDGLYSAEHTRFWDLVETGAGLDANHPILRLRHILTQNMTSPRRYDTLTVAAMVVKTWNLLRAGRVRGRIAWGAQTERFPSIT
jgi:hypothetical protein